MLDDTKDPRRQLRNAFGAFATGVTVVTLRDPAGKPTGLTVNSFSSLSLDPPLVLFSIGREQVSARWFQTQDAFNINVLSADQEPLAWQFAQPVADKFADTPAPVACNGCPAIDGAMAQFVCRKHAILDGGDHLIIIGEVIDYTAQGDDPLLFFKGKMRALAPAR